MTKQRVLPGGLRWIGVIAVVLGWAAGGCATTTTEGTNTNWVACTIDKDCVALGSRAVCESRHCVIRNTGDAGVSADEPLPQCLPAAFAGTTCQASDSACWTGCGNGTRHQLACSGGRWVLGQELFSCSCDAMDAHAGGTSCPGMSTAPPVTGTTWNGTSCEPVDCCVGKDCVGLYTDNWSCLADHAPCVHLVNGDPVCPNSGSQSLEACCPPEAVDGTACSPEKYQFPAPTDTCTPAPGSYCSCSCAFGAPDGDGGLIGKWACAC